MLIQLKMYQKMKMPVLVIATAIEAEIADLDSIEEQLYFRRNGVRSTWCKSSN